VFIENWGGIWALWSMQITVHDTRGLVATCPGHIDGWLGLLLGPVRSISGI
jgi:hypothetical protein